MEIFVRVTNKMRNSDREPNSFVVLSICNRYNRQMEIVYLFVYLKN